MSDPWSPVEHVSRNYTNVPAVLLADHYHEKAADLANQFVNASNSDGMEPVPKSLTINGYAGVREFILFFFFVVFREKRERKRERVEERAKRGGTNKKRKRRSLTSLSLSHALLPSSLPFFLSHHSDSPPLTGTPWCGGGKGQPACKSAVINATEIGGCDAPNTKLVLVSGSAFAYYFVHLESGSQLRAKILTVDGLALVEPRPVSLSAAEPLRMSPGQRYGIEVCAVDAKAARKRPGRLIIRAPLEQFGDASDDTNGLGLDGSPPCTPKTLGNCSIVDVASAVFDMGKPSSEVVEGGKLPGWPSLSAPANGTVAAKRGGAPSGPTEAGPPDATKTAELLLTTGFLTKEGEGPQYFFFNNVTWSVPGSLALLDSQKDAKLPANAASDGALTAGSNILEFKFGDVVDFVVTNTDDGKKFFLRFFFRSSFPSRFFLCFFLRLVSPRSFLTLFLSSSSSSQKKTSLSFSPSLPLSLFLSRRWAPAPPPRPVLLGHGRGRGRGVVRGRQDEARAYRGERRGGHPGQLVHRDQVPGQQPGAVVLALPHRVAPRRRDGAGREHDGVKRSFFFFFFSRRKKFFPFPLSPKHQNNKKTDFAATTAKALTAQKPQFKFV